MTTSRATAVWEGGLKGGKGTFKAGSAAFAGAYTFATRFESAKGTNPEELIAAAHAACLSMALSADLEKAGTPATRIETSAACTIDAGRIQKMELSVRGTVPGLDQAGFQKAAEGAKENCPVSKALKGNVQFVLDAKLT
jgi:osmotically inducible protein OsmC